MPQAVTIEGDVLDAGPRKTAPGAERYCAATGTVRPVDDMIRFVVAPDGRPVADLKRRLPGRGIWVTATRQALRTAVARKAFARGFKREVTPAPDFVETTERLIEQSALATLAMAHKAHRIALGFAKVDAALARERVVALVHAADAAPDGVRKLDALLRRRLEAGLAKIPIVKAFTSMQLDLALGRPNVIHAALLAGRESEMFLVRVERLGRFRDGGAGEPNSIDRVTKRDRVKKPEKQDRNG
jgi:predicted RNA-binding protein YlxR (DUF448 family)